MIHVYGKAYARNQAEVVASLFNQGGTVNGTYRKTAAGIYLSDLTGETRAFIRKDGLGPVSTFTHEGKRRFCHSTTSRDDAWLGVPESYTATIEGAKAVALSMFGARQ